MTMSTWALLALTGSSAVTDVLFGKIYNAVVLPAAITGLVLSGVPALGGSGAALAERLASMLLSAAIFLPFWVGLPGSIGGGDIKLFLSIAALLPQRTFLWFVLIAMAIAGGMGILARAARMPAQRIRIGPAALLAAIMYIGGIYE